MNSIITFLPSLIPNPDFILTYCNDQPKVHYYKDLNIDFFYLLLIYSQYMIDIYSQTMPIFSSKNIFLVKIVSLTFGDTFADSEFIEFKDQFTFFTEISAIELLYLL